MSTQAVQFTRAADPVPYPDALAQMNQWIQDVLAGGPEQVWFLEHPPLYTAGTSAQEGDLLGTHTFPVYATGRGGQMTYHGPGQRVAYLTLDLRQRGQDLRHYVWQLEEWLIRTLASLGIEGFRREGRVGIWVIGLDAQEAKIAAIGVRVSKWITMHGIALNVHPDLSHFEGIVPCGLANFGVTSLHALGKKVTLEAVDEHLREQFSEVFGG
jgi:lipoyl(octanoyl) transferase